MIVGPTNLKPRRFSAFEIVSERSVLAGTVRPSRRGTGDIRIVRGGADAPHIRVRYSLSAGGIALATLLQTRLSADLQVTNIALLYLLVVLLVAVVPQVVLTH